MTKVDGLAPKVKPSNPLPYLRIDILINNKTFTVHRLLSIS